MSLSSMLLVLVCLSAVWSAPTLSPSADPKTPRFFNFLDNFEKEVKSSSSLSSDKAFNLHLDSLTHAVLQGDVDKHFPSVVHQAQEVKKAQEFEVSVGRHCRTYVDPEVSSESDCHHKHISQDHRCFWDEHRNRVDAFFDEDSFKFDKFGHRFEDKFDEHKKFEEKKPFDDDKGFENKAMKGACVCPRSFKQCLGEKRCYWFHDPHHDESSECISSAERLYKVLSKLLLKRGKKDFAIRIDYKSAPARGLLPYGPHGPAVFGFGDVNSHYDTLAHGSNVFNPKAYGPNPYVPSVYGGSNVYQSTGYGPKPLNGPNVYGPGNVNDPYVYGPSAAHRPDVYGQAGAPNVYDRNVYGPGKGYVAPGNVYGPSVHKQPLGGKEVYGSGQKSDVYTNSAFKKDDVYQSGPVRQQQTFY